MYESVVTRSLKTVIYTLAIWGCCPLDSEAFQVGSFRFLRPTSIGILSVILTFGQAYHLILGTAIYLGFLPTSWSEFYHDFMEALVENVASTDSSKLRATIASSIQHTGITLSLVMLFPLVADWLNVQKLIKYLNDWKMFDIKYLHVFHSPITCARYLEASKTRVVNKWLVNCLWGFNLSCMGFHVFLMLRLKSIDYQHPLEFVSTAFFGLSATCLMFLQDVKTVLMTDCVSRGLRRMNEGITSRCKFPKEVTIPVVEQEIRDWRELVGIVRKQCHLLCDYMKAFQLFFICCCIQILTTTTFLSQNASSGSSESQTAIIMWGSTSASFGIRLYLRTVFAENIVAEETRLLTLVRSLRAHDFGANEYVQLKIFKNMLANTPSTMKFGSFMILSKLTLLTIFGHVISYYMLLSGNTTK